MESCASASIEGNVLFFNFVLADGTNFFWFWRLVEREAQIYESVNLDAVLLELNELLDAVDPVEKVGEHGLETLEAEA